MIASIAHWCNRNKVMFQEISLPGFTVGIIVFIGLFSSVSLIPVSSNTKNIKCGILEKFIFPNTRVNLSRRMEFKESFGLKDTLNLDESAFAALSKLANLRLSNLAGLIEAQKRIPLPIKNLNNIAKSSEKVGEYKPRKFHCHPIDDIFIPAVNKLVPAYVCKFEYRQFIISSERFMEDYKYHLDVTVDEATFQRLSIPDNTKSGNSMASVIPVTLTQRQGDEFYGIKKN